MADVLYVRNGRPNRLIIKHAGLKYLLERRGSREDTASLPVEAENDPVVARFLRTGYLEKVSKEAFMTLNARDEDQSYELNVRKAKDVEVPMGHAASQTPTVIADKDLQDTAHLRTPDLQFAKNVSTDVELGFAQPEGEEVEVDQEKEDLRRELDELKAAFAAAQQDQENKPKPAAKKKAAPRKRAASNK